MTGPNRRDYRDHVAKVNKALMTDRPHRHRRLLDAEGQPIETMDFDVRTLPLIERDALPDLPDSMEGRLLNQPGLEPALVLFHPKAELYRLVRLTTLPDSLQGHYDAINTAVLMQAMGEPPADAEGYRVDG